MLSSLSLLAACGTPPRSETVQLSKPSSFDIPLDNRWRKASETRPIAILLGRAETTRIVFPRKAVLRTSCDRGPRVRVTYDVGLKTGPIRVAYRFDDKTEQKGVVRVRGPRRNMVMIDNPATATAFNADLRTSRTLRVRAARPPFELHTANFNWDPNDKTLQEVLTACSTRMLDSARRSQRDAEKDDDDTEDDVGDVLPEH
jgi:hypothetical protein